MTYNKHGMSRGSEFLCLNCEKRQIRRRHLQKYCNGKCQMEYEYKTGIRDKFAITKKANEAMRKRGMDKFNTNPTTKIGKRIQYDLCSIERMGIISPLYLGTAKRNGTKRENLTSQKLQKVRQQNRKFNVDGQKRAWETALCQDVNRQIWKISETNLILNLGEIKW